MGLLLGQCPVRTEGAPSSQLPGAEGRGQGWSWENRSVGHTLQLSSLSFHQPVGTGRHCLPTSRRGGPETAGSAWRVPLTWAGPPQGQAAGRTEIRGIPPLPGQHPPRPGPEKGLRALLLWGGRSPPLLVVPSHCCSLYVRAVIHRARSLLGTECEHGPRPPLPGRRLWHQAPHPQCGTVRGWGSRGLPRCL